MEETEKKSYQNAIMTATTASVVCLVLVSSFLFFYFGYGMVAIVILLLPGVTIAILSFICMAKGWKPKNVMFKPWNKTPISTAPAEQLARMGARSSSYETAWKESFVKSLQVSVLPSSKVSS